MKKYEHNETLELKGKTYALVGDPSEIPMGLFRASKRIEQKSKGTHGDAIKNKVFYFENMDAILDVVEGYIRYGLGAEQYEAAKDDLDSLPLIEFCEFGLDVMGKYQRLSF